MAWVLKGNIMGPAGVATIPDPLPVATEVNVGGTIRLAAVPHGGKIEVRYAPTSAWETKLTWTDPTP